MLSCRRSSPYRNDGIHRFELNTQSGLDIESYRGSLDGWQNVLGTDLASDEYRVLLAPGRTTVKLELRSQYSIHAYQTEEYYNPVTHATTPAFDMIPALIIGNVQYDGPLVWDNTHRVNDTVGAVPWKEEPSFLGEQITGDDHLVIPLPDIDADELFTVEIELEDHLLLYDAFIDRLAVEFTLVILDKNSNNYARRALSVENIFIEKEFMVRTHQGIDPDFSMTLPVADMGVIEDMRLSRHYVPVFTPLLEEQLANTLKYGADEVPKSGHLWKDLVETEIFGYQGSSITSVTLKTLTPYDTIDAYATNFGNPSTALARVMFKDGSLINPYNYRLGFSPTSTSTSSMLATGFYWQVKDSTGEYPWSVAESSGMNKWMPDVSLTVSRGAGQSFVSDTGKLLFGDLSDYAPLWAIDTLYLSSHDRKYIEYSTWSEGAPSRYANPITFQADSDGGGVITYGLSQMITMHHVWDNVTISDVYMDYIARANSMNVWGHTPLKDVLQSADLDYKLEDRLELWNQEGWVDEMCGSAVREGLDTDPVSALSGGGMLDAIAYGVGTVLFAVNDQEYRDRAGNGQLDMFIEETEMDPNGADWYPEGQYTGTNEVRDLLTDTILVRPSVSETSDWDEDNPKFDLMMPGVQWATASGSIMRHQLMRAKSLDLTLNWSEAADDPTITTAYVCIKVVFGESLYWINRTVDTTEGTTVIHIDLNELTATPYNEANDQYGAPIWFSDNRTMMSVPQVVLWAYRENPNTITDMISNIRNLLWADMFYMKLEYDRDYISTYLNLLDGQQMDANAMKKYLLGLGVAMTAIGIVTLNPGTALWGVDLAMQSTMGQGLFDSIIKGTMELVRTVTGDRYFTENYIGNFSMMNMFSHKGLNLIASEALAEVISMGMNHAAGSIARRLGGSAARGVLAGAGVLDRLAVHSAFSSIDNILKISSKSSRAARLIFKGLQEYSELVGEVIVEMAFDNMLSMDPNARPLGGSGTFVMAMTLSVITMGALSSLGSRGLKKVGNSYRLTRSMSGALRVSLMALTTGLAISQLVMRLPVYMAVAK